MRRPCAAKRRKLRRPEPRARGGGGWRAGGNRASPATAAINPTAMTKGSPAAAAQTATAPSESATATRHAAVRQPSHASLWGRATRLAAPVTSAVTSAVLAVTEAVTGGRDLRRSACSSLRPRGQGRHGAMKHGAVNWGTGAGKQ
jgi:hypothetical protein